MFKKVEPTINNADEEKALQLIEQAERHEVTSCYTPYTEHHQTIFSNSIVLQTVDTTM